MTTLTPQEALHTIADGKKLEYRRADDSLWPVFNLDWSAIFIGSIFNGCYVFRLAQEMVIIGGVSFPKPESQPLEHGTEYWLPDLTYHYYSAPAAFRWSDDSVDKQRLRRGLVHLTRENATAHAKALIKLSGGTVND